MRYVEKHTKTSEKLVKTTQKNIYLSKKVQQMKL